MLSLSPSLGLQYLSCLDVAWLPVNLAWLPGLVQQHIPAVTDRRVPPEEEPGGGSGQREGRGPAAGLGDEGAVVAEMVGLSPPGAPRLAPGYGGGGGWAGPGRGADLALAGVLLGMHTFLLEDGMLEAPVHTKKQCKRMKCLCAE